MFGVEGHSVISLAATDGIPPDDFVGCRIDDCENVLVLQIHVHNVGTKSLFEYYQSEQTMSFRTFPREWL